MRTWLAKSRAKTGVKDIYRWALSVTTSPVDLASVFLIAQISRKRLIDDGADPQLFDAPDRVLKQTTVKFFESLCAARAHETNAKKRATRFFGGLYPELAKFDELWHLAFEVWICTVGFGLNTELRKEVAIIWMSMLKQHQACEAAIQRIRAMDDVLNARFPDWDSPDTLRRQVEAIIGTPDMRFTPGCFQLAEYASKWVYKESRKKGPKRKLAKVTI